MPDYSAYHPTVGGLDYTTRIPNFMDVVGVDIDSNIANIALKATKPVSGTTNGKVASLDASGELVESSLVAADVVERAETITANNLVAVDASGKLIDSLIDVGAATGNDSMDSLSDTDIVAPVTDNIIIYTAGATWNNTPHTVENISDTNIVTPTTGHILQYVAGATWDNVTLATAGISEIGHTHLMADITDSTWISAISEDTAPSLGGNLTLGDNNLIFSDVTGTQIGTANTQKLGFWAATPVAQQSAFTQTYATTIKTHADPTSTTLTDTTGGTTDNTVAAITAVNGSGATTAQETDINNNFAEVTAQLNLLRTDVLNAKNVLNAVIDDLQTIGLLA